jgi:hypothetical protein
MAKGETTRQSGIPVDCHVASLHFQIDMEMIRPLGGRGTRPSSGRTNQPDGAQEMAVWIEKWNHSSQ